MRLIDYFPEASITIKPAADSDSHIGAIQALSELLCEEDALTALFAATSEKELADIIAHA